MCGSCFEPKKYTTTIKKQTDEWLKEEELILIRLKLTEGCAAGMGIGVTLLTLGDRLACASTDGHIKKRELYKQKLAIVQTELQARKVALHEYDWRDLASMGTGSIKEMVPLVGAVVGLVADSDFDNSDNS
ncbi:hypothetical protein PG995_007321 [Apiospora arundinis]